MKNKKFITMLGLGLFFNIYSFASEARAKQASDNNNLLLNAVIDNKDMQEIDRLLALGANPDFVYKAGSTLLHYAAKNGRLDLVNKLLDLGVNSDRRDKRGMTPLMLAISNCHLDVVKALLNKGANNPNEFAEKPELTQFGVMPQNERRGESALVWALTDSTCSDKSQSVEMLKALLEAGNGIDARDRWGKTVLNVALEAGRYDFAETLLNMGANPFDVNEATRPDHYRWDVVRVNPLIVNKQNGQNSIEKIKNIDALRNLPSFTNWLN